MDETVRSMLLGTLALDALLVAAVGLTVLRPTAADRVARRRAAGTLLLAAAAQGLHFAEEVATGFGRRFPAFWELAPWPDAFFVGLNLVALAFFFLAVPALAAGWRAALVPAWLLALASLLNGVAHPALALASGGYFPGLFTAPLAALAGLWLGKWLLACSRASAGTA